jgi:two-component system cell cycle sensor histidine kinase/response regulator CckA
MAAEQGFPMTQSSFSLAALGRWPSFDYMVSADGSHWLETLWRYALILAAALILLIFLDELFLPVLLFAYLVLDGTYVLSLRRYARRDVSANVKVLGSLKAFSNGMFSFGIAYSFSYGQVEMMVIAACAAAAKAMYNLIRHRYVNILSVWDTVQVIALILYFGWMQSSLAVGSMQMMMMMVGSFSVASYYLIAQYTLIRLNTDLDRAREEAIQTQKMRAIGQLTAGIAHDFNNLLTVIHGNIEMAELTQDPDDRAQFLIAARDGSVSAGALTAQLLAYAHKAPLRADNIDIAEFSDHFSALIHRVLPENLNLDISYDPRLPNLRCDRRQLETALLNLVVNARDATTGPGEITVRFEQSTKGARGTVASGARQIADLCAITVSDQGSGMTPMVMNTVTEPFFTTKPIGKGSGLGLSMVKGFAEQSGGQLLLKSEAGKGTQITILLPLAGSAE